MVIELGNVAEWPAPALAHVDEWLERLGGKDLQNAPHDADRKLREMFAGQRIRGYHCTRLLDHEIAAIKSDGMQPLTTARLKARIERACEVGAFSSAVRDELLEGAEYPTEGREDRTCYCLPLSYVTWTDTMSWYLTRWGGERLYTCVDDDVRRCVEKIGRPTIVVGAFDVSAPENEQWFTSMLTTCMEIRIGKRDVANELQAYVTVTPEAIWNPGAREYDALGELPRT